MKRALFLIVLFTFFTGGGLASNEPIVDPLAEPKPAELSPNPLIPSAITSPENCAVPLKGPFGKDQEVFRGGDAGLR